MMNHNDIVLSIDGVSHAFGDNHVLHDVNLQIKRGQIVGLVGPSGCGKSTLLRGIVGTDSPQHGRIVVRSHDGTETLVTQPSRRIGIVYQRYSLFPNLSALENVAYGLKLDSTSIPFRLFCPVAWRRLRRQHLEQAAALLDAVGLGNAKNLLPKEMSGGMCQRVAIAQALIMKPEILLLDEPFGALDEATREDLQEMLLRLYAENIEAQRDNRTPPHTIVIVTHELNEAILVGDRVVALSQYWDWKKSNARFPGATIVYDKKAPVFTPEQKRDFSLFRDQKEEIRKAAFSPDYCQDRDQFIKFWTELGDV